MSTNQDNGNAAAMHEVLEEISSVSLGNLKDPIDGDSSNLYQDARYEGDKFVGVALPAWVAVDWYRKLKAVKEKAEAALSLPLRNCDVGKDAKTLLEEYIAMRGFTSDNQIRALYELVLPVIEWLLAPSDKLKEGNK